ncbi:AzlC family ABC transporter permease [Pseudoduganella sp. LjRoot289]|uniref:AzlC family ABC transporter permease n=1 Tax=Pseudoduganella sp. LjRoot289 TaxID=3342314 RepID=UPI003ED08A76
MTDVIPDRDRDPIAPPDVALHHEASWREGLRMGVPTLFGIGAWGLVVGMAMVKSGLTVPQALGMTLLAFAGSAQLASLPLIAAGAPVWVIFLTALAVNLRFVIFSVILAPHFAGLPWRSRFVLGYCSGDMTAALFLQKYPSEKPVAGKVSYLKGLMYPNWAAWQVGSIAGIFLGSAVPAEWGLGFAGTLAIICIMVPLVASVPAVCGVLVAGAVAVAGAGMPYKLGLLAAMVVGMLTAIAVEEIIEKKTVEKKNAKGKHG